MEVAGRLIEAGASVNLQDKVRRAGREGQGGLVRGRGGGNKGQEGVLLIFDWGSMAS